MDDGLISITQIPTAYGNGMVFFSQAIPHVERSLRLKNGIMQNNVK